MPPNMFPPRGSALQRSVSSRLISVNQMHEGEQIWIEDEHDVWVLADLLSQENTMLTIRRKDTREVKEIDLGFAETHPHNPKVVSDMTSLHHIHEASILFNLGQRSKLGNQRPYTFMGTILIAVNPLRNVEGPSVTDFMDHSLDPEAPHPYAVAELAYHQMRLGSGRSEANQSIVVSGESGAGKTETSKIILRFLTQRSVGGVSGLEQKVVETSPILESFGNAKTMRNNNSSRFGKFLKMQFTKGKYRLAGAYIETYLLEKSRVLSQGKGERNFHILYELVAGAASSGLGTELKLGGPETYKILSSGDCVRLDGVDDAAKFEDVRNALETIGMTAATQMEVWQILASVLHMSNLEFDKMDSPEGEVASISNRETLSTLASLLGVEADVLEGMLIRRNVTARNEVFTVHLSGQEADFTRDAIVKSLYEEWMSFITSDAGESACDRVAALMVDHEVWCDVVWHASRDELALFLWTVRKINASLGKGEESLPFIGVLDIFGFENFDSKNEFEQLLINFTNESLQDTFNKQVFNNELKLYRDEGIEVTVSSCPDNTKCLQMLSERPSGIIPSLDNICAEPNPSDARYLKGLHDRLTRHQDFPRTNPRDVRHCFWVKHYAGKVKYTVDGWVEKNMDRIPQSFSGTLQSSKLQVVQEASRVYGTVTDTTSARPKAGGKKSLVKPTVAKSFLASMNELNHMLLGSTCNFVRCIKPNAAMQCGIFNNRYVVEQLQCLGILQTCEVLKVGMPTRVTYTELKEVLGSSAEEAKRLFAGEPETSLIASILWAFEVPPDTYRLGTTRVFFRAGEISTVQKILNETPPEKSPWILSRLKEALANRQRAKDAAAQAQDALARAQQAKAEAEQASATVLNEPDSDDDNESVVSAAGKMPTDDDNHSFPPPVVGVDDLRPLEAVAKKARAAGNFHKEAQGLLQAAGEDGIGKFAPAAKERVIAESKVAFADIDAASSRADELEGLIRTARGSDGAAAVRKLEAAVKKLLAAYKEVARLSREAVEAAAKCEVEKTQELSASTMSKASSVEEQARAIMDDAKVAAEASKKQLEALDNAKVIADDVEAAGERANVAYRNLKSITTAAVGEEFKAREAHEVAQRKKAKAAAVAVAAAEKKAEEAVAKKKAEEAAAAAEERKAEEAAVAAEEREAEEAAERMKAEEAAIKKAQDPLENFEHVTPAPANRGDYMKRRSQSVEDFIKSQNSRVPPPSPPSEGDEYGENVRLPATKAGPRATGRMHFEAVFKEALEGGMKEGYLLKQQRFTARWLSYFFQLEDGFLKHYEKRSLVGTRKSKVLELKSHSTTAFTNTKCCFCVRTDQTAWYLIAQKHEEMTAWMTAINAQIYSLWLKNFTPPKDDYWGQGTKGRFFYGMPSTGASQWIYTHPEEGAPRTGEGIFPMEVIEITQLLLVGGKTYLRIADDRGWTCIKIGKDGEPLLKEVPGTIEEDTRVYELPRSLDQATHVLCGPAMASEVTGEILAPGDRVQAAERFTPANDDSGVVFIKLDEGRGWVPIRDV